MLVIRLSQTGKRDDRKYRVVVSDKRNKRDGKIIARLGFFDPKTKKFVIDKKTLNSWMAKGAQASFGLRKLLEKNI